MAITQEQYLAPVNPELQASIDAHNQWYRNLQRQEALLSAKASEIGLNSSSGDQNVNWGWILSAPSNKLNDVERDLLNTVYPKYKEQENQVNSFRANEPTLAIPQIPSWYDLGALKSLQAGYDWEKTDKDGTERITPYTQQTLDKYRSWIEPYYWHGIQNKWIKPNKNNWMGRYGPAIISGIAGGFLLGPAVGAVAGPVLGAAAGGAGASMAATTANKGELKDILAAGAIGALSGGLGAAAGPVVSSLTNQFVAAGMSQVAAQTAAQIAVQSGAGAAGGAANAALKGQDIGKGALTGAVPGALLGATAYGNNLLTASGVDPKWANVLTRTAAGFGGGALNASLSGGDAGYGALAGGINAGIKSGINSYLQPTTDAGRYAANLAGNALSNYARYSLLDNTTSKPKYTAPTPQKPQGPTAAQMAMLKRLGGRNG